MITENTIKEIVWADPDCSTDVVHVVKMSDGRTLSLWSGQACYDVYDEYTGKLVVGAKLVGTSTEVDYDQNHNYTVYHFTTL